jgi:endonuclease/exonuclease/phosphatase (EEP) superfamily protein YafD
MIRQIRPSPDILNLFLLLCFATYGLIFLALLAQIIPNLFVLEMIASFLPHLILLGVLTSTLLAFYDVKSAIGGAILTLIAATPFLTFTKAATPTNSECPPTYCLTIITANVFGKPEATLNLLELAARENADVVAINESINLILAPEYRSAFTSYETVIHAAWENMPRHMGNALTVATNRPLDFQDRVLRRDTGRRAYIIADLDGAWSGIRLVSAHAMTPVSRFGLQTRNALLSAASAAATEADSFILMGDFNLTPWTPAFRKLPGKRAGDPRFSRTWPVALGPFGIPIDHIMFSEDLELVEFKVLEPVGSDHYPLLAQFRRRDRAAP